MDTGHRRRPQKAFATGPPLGRWHPALLLALRFGSAFHDFWLQVLCIATEKASHASEIRLYLKLEVSSFDYTQTRHQAFCNRRKRCRHLPQRYIQVFHKVDLSQEIHHRQ